MRISDWSSDVCSSDLLPKPDDRDAVGDLAHLAELVGDEDDGGARLLEPAHDRHELVGLLRGEHRSGLVEDQHARVLGESLDDLDALLHAHGQILHERVRIYIEAEPLGDLAHLGAGGRKVQAAAEARTEENTSELQSLM